MKRRKFFVTLVFCLCWTITLVSQQVFDVNLNDRSGDTFKVTVYPKKLSALNNIFHFASTAPGTYQIMDIGRFVKNFKAFDGSGNEIVTQNTSTNQWTITNPAAVKKITYEAIDIWDSPITENKPYPMCSSTISDTFVMINGQCVFGYFEGMQAEPIRIKIDYPSAWKLGTALQKNTAGYFEAENFDHAVDSPFYLGDLTVAQTQVGGATVEVYTHSMTGLIKSSDILSSLQDILNATAKFTNGLPVDRYTFLFQFGTFSSGAWEHSYSSEYVMKEDTLTAAYSSGIESIVAHEFFHIVTPLNIHSELIEQFNFVKPTMSQHLWLYEGVTEWAAHMMLMRDGLVSLNEHFATLKNKITTTEFYSPTLSLTELGVRATELQNQYGNIYLKGSLIGELLDIRLLQLSGGTRGLREVINELAATYGKKRAFSEKNFFTELTAMTYPEVGDFIARYIQGAEKLPLQEYFQWLGIRYIEIAGYDSTRGVLGISLGGNDTTLVVTSVTAESKSGLKAGDVVEKIDGVPITPQTSQAVFAEMRKQKKIGDNIIITITRDKKVVDVVAKLIPVAIKHKFEVLANASPEQLKLREAWLKNL